MFNFRMFLLSTICVFSQASSSRFEADCHSESREPKSGSGLLPSPHPLKAERVCGTQKSAEEVWREY